MMSVVWAWAAGAARINDPEPISKRLRRDESRGRKRLSISLA
jgi:hypothetical protein